MNYSEFEALFCDLLTKNHLTIPDPAVIEQFYRFDALLHETNAVTNLTAIRTTREAISKHYVDSLLAASRLPQNARILDIGCGPGFPSIPLALYRPDLTVYALDSTAKKIAFVQKAAQTLSMNNLHAYTGRAEDAVLAKKLGQFDAVVSRAVARMNVLCELCLPFVAVGGKLVALKAAKAEDEAREAVNCIQTLGGAPAKLLQLTLQTAEGELEPRCLIEVTKTKPTPRGYPRAYAQILKKPL